MPYFELQCKSNFSFLEGASHAHEFAEQAQLLGYGGFSVTDRNTLAGVVRAHTAARDQNVRFIVGCEVHPIDGPPVVLWPQNRRGYANLCQLLSIGRLRAVKGECSISWHDVAGLSQEVLAGFITRLPDVSATTTQAAFSPNLDSPAFVRPVPLHAWCPAGDDFDARSSQPWLTWLGQFRELFGDRGYLIASVHRSVDDRLALERWMQLSRESRVPLLATGDCLYHVPERMLLQDCLSAIATGTTIDAVASTRPMNASYAMRSLKEIADAYRACPDTVERTVEVASRIDFSLDALRYEYPIEASPTDMTPIDYLKKLVWAGAKDRYPRGVPNSIIAMLKHELSIISDLKYEPYFLTVWDLVRFARSRGILCQGRGSAANSAVCFCLGVTSVDPNNYDLLFERFISRERNEAPDIDVDFEHQRREEVLQYVYEKYGRERAGMTATVITYRLRSAVRDCGKAVGLSQDRIDSLSKIVEGRGGGESVEERCTAAGIDPSSPVGSRFVYLVQSILGFPRHLSQHTGGMVMTQGPMHELCPIENAAMPGRTIIQWDKDDLDELGILKVDCLALGMLSAIRRSLELLGKHYQYPLDLASIPAEDPKVYDMICNADTVGVFQIESRAQMSMLPRLRPRCFYDLVIEVAIVRPGPIQGQMVHPYLAARKSGIQPDYPNEAIAQVLSKTMGVPIFQEQAMRLAVVAAGFTPGEADQLRRAMAAWRRPGIIDQFRRKLIGGMQSKGLDEAFAERVFNQLRGFGEYGFPESHAASFALLVYASCWIKHHYPDVFCCAMLNSQPLGFYAPSQLIQDACRHGVRVMPTDVNYSQWDCTLEASSDTKASQSQNARSDRFAMRLGLRVIRSLRSEDGERIVTARGNKSPFVDQTDLVRRAELSQSTLAILADAGALESLSGDRRAAYWQSLAQEQKQVDMPLFDFSGADHDEEIPQSLQRMSPLEEVTTDFETTGISLKGHPIGFYREKLQGRRVVRACDLASIANGRFVRVAGLIVLRQRPSTAKGITFVTMEDETGSINLVIRPETWKHYYLLCKQSNAWLVHGVLENREGVIHVLVGRVEDLRSEVGPLDVRSRDFR
ncbi:MAG: error-prone DNA polymerase [Pirellula sp.]